MMSSPGELVRRLHSLGTPPVVYSRLLEILNRPHSHAGDIAKVIGDDPGLAARLLRLVNSSFFSFPRRIESVTAAVTIVGTTQIRDLTFATSVINLFDGIPSERLDMDRFWQHSLACGVGARVIASLRREGNVERFFLTGLLHDLGRLVLLMGEEERMNEVLARGESDPLPLHEIERDVFGFDHTQVGRALVELWNLGPAFEEAVGFHHQPELAERYPAETAAVHISDIMANALPLGASGASAPPPLHLPSWEALEIPDDRIPFLIQETERQWQDGVAFILGKGGEG